ncbi:unnamed protein product [Allacma fusca]|uniref:Protein kinase domain-containing protein n=1 Tax=Allacma fusca TaxID=39272 RepID=A0A8J2P6X7_9HEXA|nr:unnamed protein product [Allacma fusca]
MLIDYTSSNVPLVAKNQLLGKGAFGMVIRGKYLEEDVAVKTTLPHAEVSYFKALLSELKVMAYIGTHANVVRFFGAVTSKIRERIVYVVLELSPFGSLESHLKASRATYVNFIENDNITKIKVTYDPASPAVTTCDLISWSQQIAAGMEYLENKKGNI